MNFVLLPSTSDTGTRRAYDTSETDKQYLTGGGRLLGIVSQCRGARCCARVMVLDSHDSPSPETKATLSSPTGKTDTTEKPTMSLTLKNTLIDHRN